MNDFESCPFCGGKDIRLLTNTAWYDAPHNRGRRAVICTDCGASVHANTNEEAIRMWNRRDGAGENFKTAMVEAVIRVFKDRENRILYGGPCYENMWKRLRNIISDALMRSARANGKLHKYRSYLEISMIMDKMEKHQEPTGLGKDASHIIMDDLIPEAVKEKIKEARDEEDE